MADRMMNTGSFKPSIKQRIYEFLGGGSILRYLTHLRKTEYYAGRNTLLYIYHKLRYISLGRNLGFSIGLNTLGYGVVIPHYGTIIVGSPAKIGNYCVLQACTCVSGNKKIIGDALYLATGGKITSPITLGNNVSVGANSLVNKSFKGDVLIGGMPAEIIKEAPAWYIRDGEYYLSLHDQVESLRKRMFE